MNIAFIAIINTYENDTFLYVCCDMLRAFFIDFRVFILLLSIWDLVWWFSSVLAKILKQTGRELRQRHSFMPVGVKMLKVME